MGGGKSHFCITLETRITRFNRLTNEDQSTVCDKTGEVSHFLHMNEHKRDDWKHYAESWISTQHTNRIESDGRKLDPSCCPWRYNIDNVIIAVVYTFIELDPPYMKERILICLLSRRNYGKACLITADKPTSRSHCGGDQG